MPISRWFVLGTGPFALEVHDWAHDMLTSDGESTAAFGGFLGDPEGAAPQTLGLPATTEDAVAFSADDRVFNAISNPDVKSKVCEALSSRGAVFATLVHPSCTVRAERIGEGSIVCPRTVVGSQTRIGRFVTINYQCGIGHESDIKDYATIAPGVQIGGRSHVGLRSNVGLSATLIDNVKIGNDVQVNAGSVVITRVRDGRRVSGNPARKTELF